MSQRVDEELRWLRANLPELIAAAVTPPAAATVEVDEPTKPVADDVQLD